MNQSRAKSALEGKFVVYIQEERKKFYLNDLGSSFDCV